MKKRSLGLPWLKAYLNEGSHTFLNATASAEKVGYKAKTDDSFRQIGYQNRLKYESKIAKWLDDHGFSEARLKTKVLELMEAKETVFQKVKGALMQSDLPPGHRVVATSGTVVTTKEGDLYGDGDTLIEIDVQALGVQVKATDMALKVKGIYAAEKVEHSGSVVTKLELTDDDRELVRHLITNGIQKLTEANHQKPA